MLNRLNLIYVLEIAIVLLIVFGVLPRWLVPYVVVFLAIYFLRAPFEEVIIFFVRSVPLFMAIPITPAFDSLNAWRIFSLIIFFRWLDSGKIKEFFRFSKTKKIHMSLMFLLILALFSLIFAPSQTLALKRIIYFVNLSLIGIVIYDLNSRAFTSRVIKNIVAPAILVTILGMTQLVTTYFIDIYKFIEFWAGTVEKNLFGEAWAVIALRANTWFAYFGDQLSLRMFSFFPDSHSFPIFLILSLPAVLALSLQNIVSITRKGNLPLKVMYQTRARLSVIFVPILFLGVILSGTRGMWAAGVGCLLLVVGYWLIFRGQEVDSYKMAVFKYISSYLSIFFLLFALAFPIFASPQFLVFKENQAILRQRVKSIIDLGETSNYRRLEIWRDSFKSIINRPLDGVGIGNFPVVVGEDLAKAKAGSSAHNLYLHIAAEMGIFALLVILYFLWHLLKKCYQNYLTETDPIMLIFFGASLIFIPWNLLYSLTDVAIFDERAFLLFVITAALILGKK